MAGADRGRCRALDGDAALADRVEGAVGERVALRLVDVDPGVLEVPVELDPGGLEHTPRGLRELGAGAVARDEGDSMSQNCPFVSVLCVAPRAGARSRSGLLAAELRLAPRREP